MLYPCICRYADGECLLAIALSEKKGAPETQVCTHTHNQVLTINRYAFASHPEDQTHLPSCRSRLRWQLSKYEIPLAQITSVTLDDTYGGSELSAVRIGHARSTERILIRTTNQSYILFTNSVNLISQIQAMVSHSAS